MHESLWKPGVQRVILDEGLPADTIRLLHVAGCVRLWFSQREPTPPGGRTVTAVLSVPVDVNAQPEEHFRVDRLLAVPVDWDVTSPDGQAPWAVLSHSGGAVRSLDLQHGGMSAPLMDADATGDFGFPRFARGRYSPPAITSVRNETEVVLLQPPTEGAFASPRTIISGPRIEGALLVETPVGPHVLFKQFQLDASLGRLLPGILCAARLDDRHVVAGPVFHPFGSLAVFEFDADVDAGQVAIVATTLDGFVLATGPRLDALSMRACQSDAELRQPTVAATDTGVCMAFQERGNHVPHRVVLFTELGKGTPAC